jgi:hypothetical protein
VVLRQNEPNVATGVAERARPDADRPHRKPSSNDDRLVAIRNASLACPAAKGKDKTIPSVIFATVMSMSR